MVVTSKNTFPMQIFSRAVLKNWHDKSFREGAMLKEKQELDFLKAIKM